MNPAEIEQLRRDAYERGQQDALAAHDRFWLRQFAAGALTGIIIADRFSGRCQQYAEEAWDIARVMLDTEPQPQRGTRDEDLA